MEIIYSDKLFELNHDIENNLIINIKFKNKYSSFGDLNNLELFSLSEIYKRIDLFFTQKNIQTSMLINSYKETDQEDEKYDLENFIENINIKKKLIEKEFIIKILLEYKIKDYDKILDNQEEENFIKELLPELKIKIIN